MKDEPGATATMTLMWIDHSTTNALAGNHYPIRSGSDDEQSRAAQDCDS